MAERRFAQVAATSFSFFISFSFCLAVGIRAQAGSLRPGTMRRKLFMGAKVQLITNSVRRSFISQTPKFENGELRCSKRG
jgi:hypothetical protein